MGQGVRGRRKKETAAQAEDFLRKEMREKKCSRAFYFPGGARSKEPACQCRRHERHRFHPWVGEDPLKEGMALQPTPVLLSGDSHGQRSLAGYGP